MSIEKAERLKREWTDKRVQVVPGVPELRRFERLTGTVKTINMNCRALVQFDTPADISWYDIDPQFLTFATAVTEAKQAEGAASPSEAATTRKKPAPAPTGANPLDLIRAQQAGSQATKSPAQAKLSAATQASDRKPAPAGANPLDLIRAQQAGSQVPTPPDSAAPKAAAAVAEEKVPGTSPLDLIRAQQAGSDTAASTNAATAASAESDVPVSAAPSAVNDPAPLPAFQSGHSHPVTSPLEQIRAQAAVESVSDSLFEQLQAQAANSE